MDYRPSFLLMFHEFRNGNHAEYPVGIYSSLEMAEMAKTLWAQSDNYKVYDKNAYFFILSFDLDKMPNL